MTCEFMPVLDVLDGVLKPVCGAPAEVYVQVGPVMMRYCRRCHPKALQVIEDNGFSTPVELTEDEVVVLEIMER